MDPRTGAPLPAGAGYPKSQRLRKRRDFLRVQERPDAPPPGPAIAAGPRSTSGEAARAGPAPVQRSSARVTTPHFVLLLARRPTVGPCRLGIVASKKIGGAVVRNRAKRLLREVFRLRAALFPAGIDLVVIAKPGAADMTFSAACREMEGVSGVLARRASDVLRK